MYSTNQSDTKFNDAYNIHPSASTWTAVFDGGLNAIGFIGRQTLNVIAAFRYALASFCWALKRGAK